LVLIGILLLLIGLGVVAVIISVKNKGKRRETDFYNLFNLGLMWLIFGIVFQIAVLWILGLAFTIAGIANHKKWDAWRYSRKNLKKTDKRVRLILLVIGSMVIVLGGMVFWMAKLGVVG